MTSIDVRETYRFGRFVLEPDRRLLRGDAGPVQVGARAFDILLMLVRNHHRVVSKDEILTAVWRGMVVEENNLAVHISALRRALGEKPGGDRLIATVSGLGYRFVGSVVEGVQVVDAAQNVAVHEAAQVDPAPAAASERMAPATPSIRPRRIGAASIGMVLVMIAVLFTIGWFTLSRQPGLGEAPRLSIAVLPFRSLGANSNQDYLADAVTDDLTTDMSHIPDSFVIARESADMFKNNLVSAASIGRALDVRYLLQGSLRGDAASLHIDVQLVDAAGGRQLWANNFDATEGGVGERLEDVVDRISSALRFTLIQVEGMRSLRDKPRDPDALDLYLRARSILDRDASFSGLIAAQRLLDQATAISPDFSDALAELGMVSVRKIGGFNDPDAMSDYRQAATVIGRSMQLAPESSLSLVANGMLGWVEARCRPAMASFQLALSSDANDVDALTGLARCDEELGDMRAMIAQLGKVLRLDPLGPQRGHLQELLGMGYLMLGKSSEALDWLNRADTADTNSTSGGSGHDWRDWRRVFLIAATEMSGDAPRAKEICREYRQTWPYLTVFRLGSLQSRALSKLPGAKSVQEALTRAGLPLYARENEDYGIDPVSSPRPGGELDPTPLSVPGARRVSTAAVETLLSRSPRPLILDLGPGSNTIPGAVSMPDEGSDVELHNALGQTGSEGLPHDFPIITMGQGPLGWASYNVSLRLVSLGYQNVSWYRGGEEAWVAAGQRTEDRRQE